VALQTHWTFPVARRLCRSRRWTFQSATILSLCVIFGYAAVSLHQRFDFDSTVISDGRSTAYQRSLRSRWRISLAAVTPTYLFTLAAVQQ